jgi:hypothetical protein
VNPWKLAAWPVRAVLSALDAVSDLKAALHYAAWQLDALDAQVEHEAELLAEERKQRPPGVDGPGRPSQGRQARRGGAF